MNDFTILVQYPVSIYLYVIGLRKSFSKDVLNKFYNHIRQKKSDAQNKVFFNT